MNINVSCAKCGHDLEIVREWVERGDYGDIQMLVMPCKHCLRQQQKPFSLNARDKAYGQGYHDGYDGCVKSNPCSDDDRDEVNWKAYEDGYRNGNHARLRYEETQ